MHPLTSSALAALTRIEQDLTFDDDEHSYSAGFLQLLIGANYIVTPDFILFFSI